MILIIYSQEKYSVKVDENAFLKETDNACDYLKTNLNVRCVTFLLNCSSICRYTKSNIAATPLNNAQPWRLFLYLNSGRLHG